MARHGIRLAFVASDGALDAIRRRLDAATPGPWDAEQWGNLFVMVDMQRPDADLIAHAPEDLRLLLDVVEEWRCVRALVRTWAKERGQQGALRALEAAADTLEAEQRTTP